jgi:two-component system sensor histidine kinase BaeS
MRRRLLTTLLIVVTAGLLSSGLGTFLIARSNAGSQAEQLAIERAQDLADALTERTPRSLVDALDTLLFPQDRLRDMSGSFGVRQIGVLYVQFDSSTGISSKVISQLPEGVEIDDIDPVRLFETGSVGGRRDDIAFGAAISRFGRGPRVGGEAQHVVFVVSVEISTDLGPAAGWFLLASAGTLLLAIGASTWLSRSLSRPVADAAEAARGIAGGDLGVRLAMPEDERSDEMADLARAINEMAAGLERSRGLERRFLLSVSHDLRTPLTSISGYAEALADGTADDSAAAGRIIGTEAERLNRLVRDLLDLARLEAHRFELDLVPLDLVESTRQAVEALSPTAGDVDLVADLPGVPVRATADADRWAQVVGNLVDNGLRHADTSLVVSLREEEGRAVLRVVDDGQGIFEADLPHIFKRLYVARSTPADRESGSGLGLAIVRELVDAMNGEVRAESPPGMGATLVVSLPLA